MRIVPCVRLLRLQWKQDIDEAARLITKAMQIDDKCEFAYETLGTIEIQRSASLGRLSFIIYDATDTLATQIRICAASVSCQLLHVYSIRNVFSHFRNIDSEMSRHSSVGILFHTTGPLMAKLQST